jgi:hypothetical protein
MKNNVVYANGYHEKQPYIIAFWKIIEEMSYEDQCNLLKFVTSCPRQPLLGFSELNPKFAIQRVPISHDHATAQNFLNLNNNNNNDINNNNNNNNNANVVARLPSSATCMNLLKLPEYETVEMLKEKLLYAIRSNSGFELS